MSGTKHHEEVIDDLVKMLKNGTSNDVTIQVEDGEMKVNMDVLMARSEYFSRMLQANNFEEGKSGSIDFTYVKKSIMEGVVYYLFSGEINFKDYNLPQLLEMMNLARMASINFLYDGIEVYIMSYMNFDGISWDEVLEGFMVLHKFNLDLLMETFICAIHSKIAGRFGIFGEVFGKLTMDMIKNLFLVPEDEFIYTSYGRTRASQIDRFRAFAFWYSKHRNSCDEEDVKKIRQTFVFDRFSEEELIHHVRKTGIYTDEEVDGRLLDIIKKQRQEIIEYHREVHTQSNLITELQEQLEEAGMELYSSVNENAANEDKIDDLEIKIVDLKNQVKCLEKDVETLQVFKSKAVINTKCPTNGEEMVTAVRNIFCGHVYDKDNIENRLRSVGYGILCPCPRDECTEMVNMTYLEPDAETQVEIDRKKSAKISHGSQ